MNTSVLKIFLAGLCACFLAVSCAKEDIEPISIGDEITANESTHEDPADYIWDSNTVIPITLNGSSIACASEGVTISGNKITITAANNYSISGTLTDGQVTVNTTDKGTVRLILNGAHITHSTGAGIYIESAKKVVLVLPEGTENSVTDGATYVASSSSDESNAAIFSMADLTVYGSGKLVVTGNYQDGITSKDGLIIKNSTLEVTAVDDAIRGKDYLVVSEANLTLTAGGDGLKSDNEEDTNRGFISIASGTFHITATSDALDAQTDVIITGGNFNLISGGGSSKTVASTASAKGIKGGTLVIIEAGTFTINSADDALHTNGQLAIEGGTFTLSTADDGIHANTSLEVNGGDIRIAKCYEGLESASVTVNGGTIYLSSSDDGLNGADGTTGGMGGQGMSAGTCSVSINGGTLYVHAGGDGLDVNGSLSISGGIIVVDGPTANDNGALDYDSSCKVTGGFLIASGSSGMAQAPSTNSSQYSLLITFSSAQKANAIFHIQDSNGEEICTYAPPKKYQAVAFSSPKLVKGSTYDIYIGGTSTGTPNNGLYTDGSYTAGTKYASFTVSSSVTKLGNR